MNKNDLKKIYEEVGYRKGWDFSRMKDEREPVPWDYIEMVIRYLKLTNHVLDIGTGGGEKFIKLSKHFSKGVGIDPSPEMINTAKDNAKEANSTKVSFEPMGAEDLQFPEGTFDVVLNRHATLVPSEIAKVLKPGGYFVTQQVERSNMGNLKKIFNDTRVWPNDLVTLSKSFEENGCRVLATGHYDVNYWVKDLESLVFWLKAVDVPENFSIEENGEQLLEYIQKYSTPNGFVTNESRDFLVVRKK